MASFYNLQTSEPVRVMYFTSSRKGAVMLKSAPAALSMRRTQVRVDGPGSGAAEQGVGLPGGETLWTFTGLAEGQNIVAVDGNGKTLAQIPVKPLNSLDSYKSIIRRFNSRGMKIDLDSHIEYVCYASEIVGEGVAFQPKSAAEFKAAITDTQLFHHDDRADPFGHTAAAATVGEGYREVSTPSLHVAISEFVSSVHIDSYAFMLYGPNGTFVISPDVGQHIFDELLFRMPMTWLRKKNMPFLASVLQALHPVLPNSTNRYSPILGLRVTLGETPNRDFKTGVPRFTFESTIDVGRGTDRRLRHEATLRLAAGGNPERSPDWVLSLKAKYECRDMFCRDRQESVGLFLNAGGN
jgi:hypothetical protein